MMRALIAAFLLAASTAVAALPDAITLYSPNPTGAQTTGCRAIFKLYDEKYGATSTFAFKPGATGMIAMKTMLEDKKFSVLCSGISESVVNTSLYPGNEGAHEQLTMVAVIGNSPTAFTTGAKSPHASAQDLLKLTRPIMAGYHSTSLQFVARTAFGNHPVVWVPHKSAQDGVPSLLDGSLDVYIDGGALAPLVAAGTLKSLGHINGPDTAHGAALAAAFPEAARMRIILAVTTSNQADARDIEELNRRLGTLVGHPAYVDALRTISNTPLWLSVADSNALVARFRQAYYKPVR
jgi:tripartite-type tricarboxylate transporter receptor subunit TctC